MNVVVRSGWSADLEDLLGLLILVGLLGLAVYTDARNSSFASFYPNKIIYLHKTLEVCKIVEL